MTAESIAAELGGRRVGASWMVRCPAHDDRNPSMSICERNGHLLVRCHAGCEQRAVIAALRERGLWPKREQRDEWRPRSIPAHAQHIATYDYTDGHGELLYQILRYEWFDDEGKRSKTFVQRRPDGAGGWIWKKHPHQVLYRLREVLEAPIVFVVEGEKDVETLREYGFVATTNAGGAKAPWLPQFTAALRGREVILIPDSDEPGYERVRTIARALLGAAAKIVIVTLDDGSKDISEWFARGHSELELIAEVEGPAYAL